MEVGIGLPNTVPGVDRRGIVDWSRRADEAGFSSLATIGRLAFGNYEELTSLAAAAAVTERIRLMTDLLLAPLYPTALLAKQTATIDHLSGGRLVLGFGVGGRPDDFELAGVDFHARGRIFGEQLEELTRIWRGDTSIGPRPAHGTRPQVLIGGSADVAFRRAAKYGDGWTMGGGTPDMLREAVPKLHAAWEAEGREGRPRVAALFYYALGDRAEEQAREDLGAYYAFIGDIAEQIIQGAAKDADTVRAYIAAFEDAGADEVLCMPTSADPAQVDLLAEVALGPASH